MHGLNKPSPHRRPIGNWALVVGTLMAVTACFDAAWGLATVALGEHLQIIAGELDRNRLGMAVGRIVHFVTFGVLGLLSAMISRDGSSTCRRWIVIGVNVVF